MKTEFKVGDIVRYHYGSSAIMRVSTIEYYGLPTPQYVYGTHCLGGVMGRSINDLKQASKEDLETWEVTYRDRLRSKRKATSGSHKIYVASSWRNETQPLVVKLLRGMGHEVYDFKNPRPGDNGFHWEQIDTNWKNWTNEQYIEALKHPAAVEGYKSDFDAMEWADTFVLVLPCGRSAHLELGWAVGKNKHTILMLDTMEPELMVKMVDKIVPDMISLKEYFDYLNESHP